MLRKGRIVVFLQDRQDTMTEQRTAPKGAVLVCIRKSIRPNTPSLHKRPVEGPNGLIGPPAYQSELPAAARLTTRISYAERIIATGRAGPIA